MLNPDYIAPEVAWPLAIILAILAFALESHARRQSAELLVVPYVGLDCRDGQHSACENCGCACHATPIPENRSQ